MFACKLLIYMETSSRSINSTSLVWNKVKTSFDDIFFWNSRFSRQLLSENERERERLLTGIKPFQLYPNFGWIQSSTNKSNDTSCFSFLNEKTVTMANYSEMHQLQAMPFNVYALHWIDLKLWRWPIPM